MDLWNKDYRLTYLFAYLVAYLLARAPEWQQLKMAGKTVYSPFEQRRFGTAGVERVNNNKKIV